MLQIPHAALWALLPFTVFACADLGGKGESRAPSHLAPPAPPLDAGARAVDSAPRGRDSGGVLFDPGAAASDTTSADPGLGADLGGLPDSSVPDSGPADPCDPELQGLDKALRVPLGETFFFDGDDLLAFWGADHPCAVTVAARPEGSTAQQQSGRFTPDLPGVYELRRGADRVRLEVVADFLNADTFLNFNYTPSLPLAQSDPETLWVANPPANTIHEVHLGAEGAEARGVIPVGSWPVSIVAWPEQNVLLVAQAGRDDIAVVDLDTRRVVDAFRVVDPRPEQYTWWSNRGRAREKNVGWRIDYQIVTPGLKDKILKARIYKDKWFSDHAPLIMDYDIEI